MLRLHKTIFAALAFVAIACGSATTARADVFTFTLPEFNTPFVFPPDPPPGTPFAVGTFNVVIPAGQQITAASLTGTFGNSVSSSSAATNLFLDGLLVAQCLEGAACTRPGPTSFSFAFSAANLALLTDGAATLTAVQTSFGAIRLAQLSLSVTTVGTIPEPATVVLLGTGLAAAAAGLRRRRRSPRAQD